MPAKNQIHRCIAGPLLATALVTVQPATADILEFEYTGEITSSEIISHGRLGGSTGYQDTLEYTPGTQVRGTFTINDALADREPGGEIDQFSADRFSDDRLNIPGFGANITIDPDNLDPDRGGRDSQGMTFQGPYASVPFGTSPIGQELNDPRISVRIVDADAGDSFNFDLSSKGGGTELPLFTFGIELADSAGGAFPGSNRLAGSLVQLTTLLRNGFAPFPVATGEFRYRRVPRLSRVDVTAEFQLTSLRLVSPPPASPTEGVELISRRADGQGGGNGTSWDPSLSGDGQIVAFSSNAANLVTDDANGAIRDIYLFDRATDELVNLTDAGNGDSDDPVLSSDGNWLVFRTRATNLPTDEPDSNGPIADIVLANLTTGALTLVTPGANAASSTPSISNDGRRLVFDTLATNIAGGNYQPFGCSPVPGSETPCYKNVILYDRVSQFRLNLTQGGMSDSRAPSINEPGTHVAFNSNAFAPTSNLVVMNIETGERRQVGDRRLTIDASKPYLSADNRWVTVLDTPYSPRTSIPPQVYLYDLENNQGYFLGTDSRLTGDFTSDGRYLFLSSLSQQLDLPDPNGRLSDIYRLDLTTAPWSFVGPPVESYKRISVGGNAGSGGPSVNHDGTVVAFDSTASNFANDNNGDQFDVFVRDLNADDNTNRTPSANGLNLSVISGNSLDIVLTGFDPDDDELQFVLQEEPANGTLDGIPPTLIYTPDQNFTGTDTLTFVVQDASSTSDPATVTISVEPATVEAHTFTATQRSNSRVIDLVATWPDTAVWTQVREYDGLTGVLWDGQARRWEGSYTPEPGATTVSFNSRYWLPGVTAAHDNIDLTITLGSEPTDGASVDGFAWFDENGDSRRDDNEGADNNRRVTLYRCEAPWGIVGEVLTQAPFGTFSFNGMSPGKYQIGTPPEGVTFTPVFNDNQIAANGFSNCFDVNDTSVQIGIGLAVTDASNRIDLTGFAWLDASNDGVRDATEQPDIAREVTAYRCEAPWGVVGTARTNDEGNFAIMGMVPGKYQFGVAIGDVVLSPKTNDNSVNANGFSDCLDFSSGAHPIGIGVFRGD